MYQLAEALGVSARQNSARRTNETTYTYTDEHNTALYVKVRYYRAGSKQFCYRQPNGTKGRGQAPLVPYRLPDVVRAIKSGERIYIVEGEKDADTLRMYGLTATTNPDGAGKWKSELTSHFTNAYVVLIPDNDEPGERHVAQVSAALAPVCAEQRIVHLPDLLPKGDISDWLQAGHTIEEFHAIVQATPVTFAPPRVRRTSKAAARLNAESDESDSDESNSDESDSGDAKQTQSERLIRMLAHWGYTFALDDTTDTITVSGKPIDDFVEAEIRTKLRDKGLWGYLDLAADAIKVAANKNRFHPVRDYLNSLAWNKQDHIERLASYFYHDMPVVQYGDTHALDPIQAYLKRFLIGAVAKAFATDQALVLVLAGPSGIGKSNFARWLCSPLPQLFHEGSIQPDNRDAVLRLAKAWIWEIGELDGTTRRADDAALKAFLTRREVQERKAYNRHDTVKPALASFVGTVNPHNRGFLRDADDRRFLVLNIDRIDWNYQQVVNINQVWAQAVALFRAGETGRLHEAERQYQKTANVEHRQPNVLQDYIEEHYVITANPSHFETTVNIIKTLRDRDAPLATTERGASMELAGAMQNLTDRGVRKHREPGTGKTGYRGLIKK
ncbi:hypothetical protein HC891_21620 [Candidatus Gracilibacteria bacterium]|nr:hypothetical protein [Candidatus Gracilibacteria bacterium]